RRFERNRLPTRIWSANHQQFLVTAERQRHWYNRAILLAKLVFQDRMPQRRKIQFGAIGKVWNRRIEVPRESRPGKSTVQFRNRFHGGNQRPAHHSQSLGESAQNAENLRRFLF